VTEDDDDFDRECDADVLTVVETVDNLVALLWYDTVEFSDFEAMVRDGESDDSADTEPRDELGDHDLEMDTDDAIEKECEKESDEVDCHDADPTVVETESVGVDDTDGNMEFDGVRDEELDRESEIDTETDISCDADGLADTESDSERVVESDIDSVTDSA
jgi:hypothetical protein